MTRTELIKAVAETLTENGTKTTQKSAKEFLDTLQEITYAEMAKGEEVKIFDSVVLLGKEMPERECRNPQTGETFMVDAHLAPKAKFGIAIKTLLKEA